MIMICSLRAGKNKIAFLTGSIFHLLMIQENEMLLEIINNDNPNFDNILSIIYKVTKLLE